MLANPPSAVGRVPTKLQLVIESLPAFIFHQEEKI